MATIEEIRRADQAKARTETVRVQVTSVTNPQQAAQQQPNPNRF